VFDSAAVEKIGLIGLLGVIYGEVLPGVEASGLQIFVSIAGFAIINSAIGLWAARRGHSWESPAVSFAVVFGVNVALVAIAALLTTRGPADLQLADTLSSSSCSALSPRCTTATARSTTTGSRWQRPRLG
jgi:hypothetical protein